MFINKKKVIVFLKSSIGELHITLPILYNLKKKMQNEIEVIFASASIDILNDLQVPAEYRLKMSEIGEFFFGKKELINLLKRSVYFRTPIILMTCDSGAGSIEKLFYTLTVNSHILHFHHAFALHSLKPASEQVRKKINLNKRYVSDSSIFLNSESDKVWYESIGFSSQKVFYVGALGYSHNWIQGGLGLNKLEPNQEKLTIFVPLRDIHPLYLTESNHYYLIDSLVALFKHYSSYSFIVKLHPRQKNKQWIDRKLEHLNNLMQSNLSTFQLAAQADLTVSFWSSAITDSLAAMTPAVEFYRHEVMHDQLIKQDDRLVSIYHQRGFCEFFDNREGLIKFIGTQTKKSLTELLTEQRKRFESVFGLDEGIYDRLEYAFNENFKIAEKRNIFETKRFKVLFKICYVFLNFNWKSHKVV